MAFNFFKDIRPEDVFTPRRPDVNKSMYVDRPEYERELRRAIRSKYHIVIFGDSGCGKSWLYKKVFEDDNIAFASVDLTGAMSADDLDLQMLEIAERDSEWVETEKTVSAEAGLMPYNVGGKRAGATVMRKKEASPFEQLCGTLRKVAGRGKAFVVFENLEQALEKEDIVQRLRSLILSIDDISSKNGDIQILLVGVPTDIRMILSDNNKFQTVSNRVIEISEISRMSKEQARHLIRQGFVTELQMVTDSFDYCISQILYLTDRIPQYLHDLCLQIAFVAEDSRNTVNPRVVVEGAHQWVDTNGRQSREFIARALGPRSRRYDQKSKYIYAVAAWERTTFYSEDIEKKLREEFPKTIGDKRLQCLRTLNALADGDHRLLKKIDGGRQFKVVSPKLRSVLRHCVYKDSEDEAVKMRNSEDLAHSPEYFPQMEAGGE